MRRRLLEAAAPAPARVGQDNENIEEVLDEARGNATLRFRVRRHMWRCVTRTGAEPEAALMPMSNHRDSGVSLCRPLLGRGVGLVDGAREKDKACAVVEITAFF